MLQAIRILRECGPRDAPQITQGRERYFCCELSRGECTASRIRQQKYGPEIAYRMIGERRKIGRTNHIGVLRFLLSFSLVSGRSVGGQISFVESRADRASRVLLKRGASGKSEERTCGSGATSGGRTRKIPTT